MPNADEHSLRAQGHGSQLHRAGMRNQCRRPGRVHSRCEIDIASADGSNQRARAGTEHQRTS